jgi:hypothetical protein
MDTAPFDQPLTTAQVIRWWEFRRPLFNFVLLIIGLSSIAAMEWLIGRSISEGEDATEPNILFLIIMAYGFLVNLWYTLGWVMELWERKAGGPAMRERAKLMFQAMLAISSILASGPLWYACAYRVMRQFPFN